MRIVTWNCRVGKFREKARYVEPLQPHILAVQEVEPLDNFPVLAGESQPRFRERAVCPSYPRRGIGMFSYNDAVTIKPVDLPDPLDLSSFAFRRYTVDFNDLHFHMIAVWPYATKIRLNSYRQAHQGLEKHRDWILESPTIVLGDFNQSRKIKGDGWKSLVKLTNDLGLTSAYHEHFKQEFGEESSPTYFHLGDELNPFHLDYCFLPKQWVQYITSVEVKPYDQYKGISDHVPLIVDLDLPKSS